MMTNTVFDQYKVAVQELTAARLDVKRLETRVGELEALIADPVERSVGPGSDLAPRFVRLLEIFRKLGGRARLRDIAEMNGLTTAGTLAQIRFLESKGLVRLHDRGVYELKREAINPEDL